MAIFFEKFEEQSKEKTLAESVLEEINIILESKSSPYFTYDFKNKVIENIKEPFDHEITSPEFKTLLAKVIEVFDPRVKSVSIETEKIGAKGIIKIKGYAEKGAIRETFSKTFEPYNSGFNISNLSE